MTLPEAVVAVLRRSGTLMTVAQVTTAVRRYKSVTAVVTRASVRQALDRGFRGSLPIQKWSLGMFIQFEYSADPIRI